MAGPQPNSTLTRGVYHDYNGESEEVGADEGKINLPRFLIGGGVVAH